MPRENQSFLQESAFEVGAFQGGSVNTLARIAGKKKAYTALLHCRTFLCRKKWGPQRKDFGGGYGFPGFSGGFCIHHWPGKFSFQPEKFPKRCSFGGGRVRFFLPAKIKVRTSVRQRTLFRSCWGSVVEGS